MSQLPPYPPQGSPPQGAWSSPWPGPFVPGPPVVEPRSAGASPLVVTLAALGALLVGGIVGFLIGVFVVMAAPPGMADLAEIPLPPTEQFPAVAPGDLGPDPVLDEYAGECFAGELQACDDLYYESPPLSEYENYGLTCGGRVKEYVGAACIDLE